MIEFHVDDERYPCLLGKFGGGGIAIDLAFSVIVQ